MANRYIDRSTLPVPVQDRDLSGQGFVFYHVTIEMGLNTSQPARTFAVAGPASLPDVGELWETFKLGREITAEHVDAFVELLRANGYVQIEQTTALGLNY